MDRRMDGSFDRIFRCLDRSVLLFSYDHQIRWEKKKFQEECLKAKRREGEREREEKRNINSNYGFKGKRRREKLHYLRSRHEDHRHHDDDVSLNLLFPVKLNLKWPEKVA